jgi:phosphatidate phosphatase APP1
MGLFKTDKLQIICFQGYGTNDRLHLGGRALEDKIIDLEQKGFLALVLNTWKRFETDETKHAEIKGKAGGSITLKANTDTNGYYLINQRFKHLSRFANT